MALPITLTNAAVAADAQSGAVIGTFNTDGLRFQPNGNPYGYFLLVGRLLVVTWDGQAMPGQYTVQVHAPGGSPASFMITITAAVAPGATGATGTTGATGATGQTGTTGATGTTAARYNPNKRL